MKAKELIKLLYDNPHMDVAFLDEWGVQSDITTKLVKISNGTEYSVEDLQILRAAVANYDVEIVTKDYNELLVGPYMDEGHSLEESIAMWGTLKRHLELCHGKYIQNLQTIAECDTAEYTVLLVSK